MKIQSIFSTCLACFLASLFWACAQTVSAPEESFTEDDREISGTDKNTTDDSSQSEEEQKKSKQTINGVTYELIHVSKGSTKYRLCLDPDNSNNCTTPTLRNEEGDYYLTKLGMVNSMFTESEAKADKNCKTSVVGYDTCKEQGDYYNLAKAACKKTGGELPTINELITLKKYKPSLFPWGMFTWSSDVLTEAEDSYSVGSWYQMYSDGTDTNPKIHIHNNDTSDKGVGNIQVLCVAE